MFAFVFYFVILCAGLSIVFCKPMLRDVLSYTIYKEEWELIKGRKFNFDYSWMSSNNEKIRIAHALGFANADMRNSFEGYVKAKRAGFKFYEVDLWLDEQGIVRCHHGPDLPSIFKIGDCSFSTIQEKVCSDGNYLVLDIKTDFASTMRIIEPQLLLISKRCIIFQLYKPSDFLIFEIVAEKHNLLGPIYTYYLTRRNIKTVFDIVVSSGVKAITAPISANLSGLKERDKFFLLAHPIDDCESYHDASNLSLNGIYTTVDFLENKLPKCDVQ